MSDELRRLIAETNALPKAQLPGWGSLTWNHPGVLAYGVKDPQQYDQDMRRAHFLDAAKVMEDLPPQLALEAHRYKTGQMGDLRSPYHRRGYLAPGAPLHNAMGWMQSLPSMGYHASAMLANAVDPVAPYDPDAKRKFDSALNTFTMYGAEDRGLVPKGTPTIMEPVSAGKEAMGSVPWHRLSPDNVYGVIDAVTSAAQSGMLMDGRTHLTRAGVPSAAAGVLGAVMDGTMDPFVGLPTTWALSRAGKTGAAAVNMAQDYALPLGIEGIINAPKGYSVLQNLVNGLDPDANSIAIR